MRKHTVVFSVIAAVVVATVSVVASARQQNSDHEQITNAVLDYVNSIYDVKPELLDRSVSPDLVKFGYWRHQDTGEWEAMPMTFEQLKDLAGHFNAEGAIPSDAPKKIVVHDVRDRTASASLDAYWGMDHIHLVKTGGRWQILQVLWQATPGADGH